MFTSLKKIKPQISIIITLLFIGYLLFYFFDHQEEFSQLLEIRLLDLLLICGLQILTLFLNGIFIQKVLIPYQVLLKTRESFRLSVMSSFGNYFTPFQGGLGARAVYLKKNHKLPYSNFLSTLYGNYIIVFLFVSLVALVTLFYVSFEKGSIYLAPLIIFGGIHIGSLLLMFVPSNLLKNISLFKIPFVEKILEILEKVLKGWSFIRKQKQLLTWLLLLTVLNVSVQMLITWVSLNGLGITIDWVGLILYVSISSLSLLISITPGSIGIRETLLILFQEVVGLSQADVLQSSVIIRSSMFFVLLTFGSLFFINPIFKKKFREFTT